ncbi:Transposase [Mycolicibacterium rutilum]|uniref:Transposase n=1 Tax=Mycolicibacterium rutilum TaxID=370526 RepID=A0A1H6J7K4_MYCRU|nr:Transposase [Mycolicibacterium rutilum]SEH89640.1 Transposase [Mycolicibacterium rutilum]SEH91802.1 Transposase [Mycolicibacterium rutilum]
MVRDQEFLLPPNMADWLPADHLVWFVLDVVEQLDTSRLHAQRRTGGVGRAGYDPDMLLALLIYAYATGQRSSRQIERLCTDHVAYRVVCAQDRPDHTTIARFRAAHDEAFTDLFAQVLRLCAQAGMVQVGVVSIDGTKIAANASKSANRSQRWVAEQARRIAEDVVSQAAAVDAAEDAAEAQAGPAQRPPAELATPAGRAAAIKRAKEEIARQDAANAEADAADEARQEHYLQRVEAGEVVSSRPPAGVDQVRLYQARIAREQRRLAPLLNVRGTAEANQRAAIRKILKKAQAGLARAQQEQAAGLADRRGASERRRVRLGVQRGQARGPVVNLTDPQARLMVEGAGGGSVQGYNSQIVCSDDHFVIGLHISQDANDLHCWTPALAAATTHMDALNKTIELVLADNGYFTEDNITSPGPERLIAPGRGRAVHHDAKHQSIQGPPPPDLSPRDAMRHTLRDPEQAQRYKRRSATVEPVIGHLKDRIGLRRFARRGLAAVSAELHLAAAALNLTKLHTATAG